MANYASGKGIPLEGIPMRLLVATCAILLLNVAPASSLTYAFTTGSAFGSLTWDPDAGFFGGVGGGETSQGYELYPSVQGSWSFELYATDGTPIRDGASSYRYDFAFWSVSRSALPDYTDPLIDRALWVLEYDNSEMYQIDIRGGFCPDRYDPSSSPLSPSCLTHFDFAAATSATINGEAITGWSIVPEPGTGLLLMTGLLGTAVRRRRRVA